jgi:hypothetical protein
MVCGFNWLGIVFNSGLGTGGVQPSDSAIAVLVMRSYDTRVIT